MPEIRSLEVVESLIEQNYKTFKAIRANYGHLLEAHTDGKEIRYSAVSFDIPFGTQDIELSLCGRQVMSKEAVEDLLGAMAEVYTQGVDRLSDLFTELQGIIKPQEAIS